MRASRAARAHLIRRAVVVLAVATAMAGCGGEGGDGDADASGSSSDAPGEQDASAPPGGGDAVRYLALGDSLSQGVGAPDEATGSFPAVLAERWRSDGCTVELRNAGISGYTAGQIITDQLPEVEAFDPTVITFQTGANDIANGVTIDQYRSDVATVLDAAVDSGARVLVLTQNEWFRSPTGPDYGTDLAEQREAFDAVLIEETEAHDAEFVDLRSLYAQEADDEQWVEDGLHPTSEVYASWATAIADDVPAPCA